MSDWFSFWGGQQPSDTSSLSSTINTSKDVSSSINTLEKMKSSLDIVSNLTGLLNIPIYKKDRDIQLQAIKNEVLAGQEQIFKELAYNTDQTITYAASKNVSIGSPVLRQRFQKGSQEAGFDFAMMQSNADIQRLKINQDYAAKRRAQVSKAINSIGTVLQMAIGSGSGGWGNTGAAYGLESTVGVNGVPMYGGSMS